jgi:hypothetical protein
MIVKNYLIIIMVIIGNVKLFSQDSFSSHFPKNHFAIQYQIEDFLKISDFSNGVFSIKYLLNNTNQIRVGVSFGYSNGDRNQILNGVEYEDNSFGTKLSAQYLFNVSTFNNVILYSGGGPYFEYSLSEFTYKEIIEPIRKGNRKYIYYGLDFVVGVEWFINNNFSLSLENGFNVYHSSSSQTNINDFEEKHFGISGNQVKLGLAVFF